MDNRQPIKRFSAFIYGLTGAGKTYLARTALDSPLAPILVCSCDAGHLTLKDVLGETLVVTPIENVTDFTAIGKYLSSSANIFNTVMIDNLSELHRVTLLARAAANSQGKTRDAFTLTQQDYGEARNQMLSLVSQFVLGLPKMNVIATALAVKAQGEDSSTIEVSLGGKLAYELPSFFDVVGYLSKVPHDVRMIKQLRDAKQPIPPESRVLQVESTNVISQARNRGGYLPDKIVNPSLAEIYKLLTVR